MTPTTSPCAADTCKERDVHHTASRSDPSICTANSSGTVQHHRVRSLSASSLSSLCSLWNPSLRQQDGSGSSRSPSIRSTLLHRVPTTSSRHSGSDSYSRRASLASVLSSRFRPDLALSQEQDQGRLLDVAENDGEICAADQEGETLIVGTAEKSPLSTGVSSFKSAAEEAEEVHAPPSPGGPELHDDVSTGLRRWLSTLRQRKIQSKPKASPRLRRWNTADAAELTSSPIARSTHHKASGSHSSSLAFVTAVRSATATLASFSAASVSRGTTPWRRGHQRSSLFSSSDPRPSIDSRRSIADEAAKQRARKRREKLEELVRTEESYVADIRALSNAYFTIIGHQPTSTSFARSSAQKNLSEILSLHIDLLSALHRILPFVESDNRTSMKAGGPAAARTHSRWHSVDGVVSIRGSPSRSNLTSIRQGRRSLNLNRSEEDDRMVLRSAPPVAAAIAKAFSIQIGRFAVYEEYGANYELLHRDIDETQRAITTWPDFDKAIEALSTHINPMNSREANKKKALTIKDLLIKPIQRLPRYELLFNDLCRLTPVCDGPDSNAALQELLLQLSWLCQRVNDSKNDPIRSRMLETTWLVGDRLTFANQVPRSVYLQLLGQVRLCGCLYVTWRGKERIKGAYVICILFDSTMLFLQAEEDLPKYTILAGVPLANAMIVESDNGKGLQCYTAPHSWKLVFEYSARMYEFILTACSMVEAQAWRREMDDRIVEQGRAAADGLSNVFELQSPLVGEMRSVGKAFGKPGSFVRRMSVHRTATVGPTTDLNQVIIKNTRAVKEALDNSSNSTLQIPRSQSVVTPSHVQTLAPRRADRVRLESLLSDVWSKDQLPYPGMQPRLSGPIRASANHVIRKFSMASITSNFTSSKRSASYTSVAGAKKEGMPPPKPRTLVRGAASYGKASCPPPRPVDFHNAPEAFLPADFELKDSGAKRKRSALRAMTLTMERPFSPLIGNDPGPLGLKRAQSVKDAKIADLAGIGEGKDERSAAPIYSVVPARPKTPARCEPVLGSEGDEVVVVGKTPRKSKSRSRLLRLFG